MSAALGKGWEGCFRHKEKHVQKLGGQQLDPEGPARPLKINWGQWCWERPWKCMDHHGLEPPVPRTHQGPALLSSLPPSQAALIRRDLCPQSCRTSSFSELTQERSGVVSCMMILSCEPAPPGTLWGLHGDGEVGVHCPRIYFRPLPAAPMCQDPTHVVVGVLGWQCCVPSRLSLHPGPWACGALCSQCRGRGREAEEGHPS